MTEAPERIPEVAGPPERNYITPPETNCPECGAQLVPVAVGYESGSIERETWMACRPCAFFRPLRAIQNPSRRVTRQVVEDMLREERRKGIRGGSSSSGRRRKKEPKRGARAEQGDLPAWGDDIRGMFRRFEARSTRFTLRLTTYQRDVIRQEARERDMAIADLVVEAVREWEADGCPWADCSQDNDSRLELAFTQGERLLLDAAAEARGMSLNGVMLVAIDNWVRTNTMDLGPFLWGVE